MITLITKHNSLGAWKVKIKIELDLDDEEKSDKWLYEIIKHANEMYGALSDLDDLCRSIRKGHVTFKEEDLLEKMQEILAESKFYDIDCQI